MREALAVFEQLFGASNDHDITAWQMALRAILIYTAVILFLRIGKKRSLGAATAFDFFLGVLMGSIAGRAVTGDAPIPGALAACITLIAVHWVYSKATAHWHGLGIVLKGRATVLVKDGIIDERGMAEAHLSRHDLEAELRLHNVTSLSDVAEAHLERSGAISIVTKRQ